MSETISYKGFEIVVEQDEMAIDPREWVNIIIFVIIITVIFQLIKYNLI